MGAYTYSTTAASNTSVDGIGAQGSDSPDNIDNLVRALAASDAALVRDLGGANTVAGTADAVTVSLADPTAATAYFDGMLFSFRAASDNTTTTPTLNVDTIGAKTIKKAVAGVESALLVGDIQAGGTYTVVYRSAWASAAGAFELLNPYLYGNVFVGSASAGNGTASFGVYGTDESAIFGRFAASASGPVARFQKSRNATVGSHTVVQSGDTMGIVLFSGSDGTGFIEGARISAEVDGTPGTNDMPGRLVFRTTADGASSSTERLRIKSDGGWNIATVAGSDGQVVKQVSGATAWGGISTFGTAQATTSGTSIDFTSIPSWVREIDVIFDEVSTNGTDSVIVQIGDSGGVENSGYLSTSLNITATTVQTSNSTAGFLIFAATAADVRSGILSIKNITGNRWIMSGVFKGSTTTTVYGAASKELTATLDRVRVTTTGGTNTFDAGSVNICYR